MKNYRLLCASRPAESHARLLEEQKVKMRGGGSWYENCVKRCVVSRLKWGQIVSTAQVAVWSSEPRASKSSSSAGCSWALATVSLLKTRPPTLFQVSTWKTMGTTNLVVVPLSLIFLHFPFLLAPSFKSFLPFVSKFSLLFCRVEGAQKSQMKRWLLNFMKFSHWQQNKTCEMKDRIGMIGINFQRYFCRYFLCGNLPSSTDDVRLL